MSGRAPAPPRRLRTADVELASAIETTGAFACWRQRLRHLRVVSAKRFVKRAFMLVTTESRGVIQSADGWRRTTDSLKAIDFIDVADFLPELRVLGWDEDGLTADRIRAALRLVLREELAVAGDELATRLSQAGPPTEC